MKKFIDDKVLGDKAIRYFDDSYNCAQSVILVYTDFLKIDTDIALNISCGFGAGMGRLQGTCGAVTAAFMIFGLLNSQNNSDNETKKAKTYSMIQRFHNSFTINHRTTNCKDLINCDLNKEEGQEYFKTENLKKEVCEVCIRDSIMLINEIIVENSGTK